ncbi:MAG: hypothetical protein OET81_02760 [Desulfobacteraceae bacterium]|jgi:hypothetical protein|nr:hypothetical protein [Desulfobacteraceae bacterium]MDH3572345.1 hypothetical protein [Desulfobacteraceae bacterium]MDH3721008.1 hypothetical protein [Desulfobacteraceae bacterium]MDH3835923.1 hypothetical protein [Desulfobacteraceae bacterium]MDH3872566.1 hypothetical protein [Desulfobacteraceae bacterium]
MVIRAKILWTVLSMVSLIAIISVFYTGFRKILSLPFRQTNDLLHEQGFPLTLDFLIPAGLYIDETITVKEILHSRLHKPGKRVHLFLSKISESIPVKYRVTATTVFYLFWTLLFLVFFRIFTWMRYTTALFISFFFGATVYFFMPDFIMGKIDDSIFLGWALTLLGLRWWIKRRKVKDAQ